MTTTAIVDKDKLRAVLSRPLLGGVHEGLEHGACVMEAVAYVAGEVWSDSPRCACPVISALLRSWNDSIQDNTARTRLLAPLIELLVGSRSTPVIELRRSYVALDWLVRTQVPAWLRLAGLAAEATSLEVHA